MDFNGLILSGHDVVARVVHQRVEPVLPERMPLFLTHGGSFQEWLTSRAVDRHRPNSRILKKILRLSDTSDLSTVLHAHAATVTDDYWVRAENEELAYEDIIFTEDAFADIALSGDTTSFNRDLSTKERQSNTPELTNIGSYEKCWRLRGGVWYLYKRGSALERFSELFTAKLTSHFGFPAAEYEAGDGVVISKDFTNGVCNYEPMASLLRDEEDYLVNYDLLQQLKPSLAIQYVDLMYMDALCFNMDRHTYNYGLLRDRKSGEILSMAPNYDNNIALISRGYAADAKHSSNLLIDMFVELLASRKNNFEMPALSKETVMTLAASCLPDDEIDRNYVTDFVMDRYARMASRFTCCSKR